MGLVVQVAVLEDVTQLFLLGAQIPLEGAVGFDLGRHALRDFDARSFQRRNFFRIVGHQPDPGHPQQFQRFRCEIVCTVIGGKPKLLVCFYGVQALVLQCVCPQLGHQPDAPALLLLIQKNSRARLGNFCQRQLKLQPAIAAQRAENVAGKALRVDAHQWRLGMNVAHYESDQSFDGLSRFATGTVLRAHALKTKNPEHAPSRGEFRLGDLLRFLQSHVPILRLHPIAAGGRRSKRLGRFSPYSPTRRYIGRVTDKLILITLLVKLGVVASVASILARASTFRRLFFAEQRRPAQTVALLAFFLAPLTIGVWLRFLVPNFQAADISLETVVLLGLLLSTRWAMLAGAILSVPAVWHHEFLALPFNVAVGLAAGTIGRFVEVEEIWSFTPFIDLSLYRWIRRNLIKPRIDRQILLLFAIALLEMLRDWIASAFPHRLFALLASKLWLQALVWLAAPIDVGIALKVWNALRLEMSLEEQKRLLLEARLDALQRQINPHFLFNTLNSVAALVRSQPELARQMTVKLANILRALLKDHDTYVPLRDELKFTDDYLDIEVVRFGADKLHVEKEIDPLTLDVMVPSILLQPLIENSIKHGLEPRIHGGTVTLRSRLEGDRISIEVADDGVGISEGSAPALRRAGSGIGIKNVKERLEVLYGNQARFNVVSNPGRGTSVSIELPASLNGAS